MEYIYFCLDNLCVVTCRVSTSNLETALQSDNVNVAFKGFKPVMRNMFKLTNFSQL